MKAESENDSDQHEEHSADQPTLNSRYGTPFGDDAVKSAFDTASMRA